MSICDLFGYFLVGCVTTIALGIGFSILWIMIKTAKDW